MLKDIDIREPLFDYLDELYGRIRIIEEKITGKSRADVVMVTENEIIGIEIKSDADTYARLAGQIKDYDKYYDRNYVVVGTSHALHIKEHVPDYWGIITVEEIDGAADFYEYRKPQKNPKVKYSMQFSLLWRPELAQIQQKYGMPKYKDKRREFVVEKLLERVETSNELKKIPFEELKCLVSDILLERDYTTIEEVLSEYRKGELQKRVEAETDSATKLQLMLEQAEKRKNLPVRAKKRRASRKRH